MGLSFDLGISNLSANIVSTAKSVSNLVGSALDFASTCVDTMKWILDDPKSKKTLEDLLFAGTKPKV